MRVTDKSSWWLLGLLAVIVQIPHSMALWGNGNYPTDICVYMRCADWIQDGLIMYRDMFDHKGPLVYMIYWCITFLGVYGVWLLDVLILFVTLRLTYRSARLFENEHHSMMISVIIACFIQAPFIDEGGPDWLVLPGTMYCLYIFLKHWQDHTYCSFSEICLFSAAVGVCLATKPNTSAFMIPLALYFAVHLFRNRDWHIFGRYASAVVVGLGAIAIPVTLWVMRQDNSQEMLEAYLRFNFVSYGAPSWIFRILSILAVTAICLPAIYCYVIYARSTERKNWKFAFITVLCLFTLIMNGYLKNSYPHYLLPAVPVFAMLFILAWPAIKANKRLHQFTVYFMLFVGVTYMGVRTYLRLMPFPDEQTKTAAVYINNHIRKGDYVAVIEPDDRSQWNALNPSYSLAYRLWMQLDAKPASSLFYIPPTLPLEMRQKSWEQIREREPSYVVCTNVHDSVFVSWGYTRLKEINIYNDYFIYYKP